MKQTKIYGQSDDNIYIDGEYSGQYSYFGTDTSDKGILIIVNDGTILEIKYGKGGLGIWGINLIRKGTLFDKIDYCTDEDAEIYSDIALFKEGVSFVYACSDWEIVK